MNGCRHAIMLKDIALKTGYTNTIAVILGDIYNPHFSIMMKEIDCNAWKLGYTSILFNTNEDEKKECAFCADCRRHETCNYVVCNDERRGF